MVDLDFQGFFRAFFRCNHQQHRQRNSKTVNGKADICQQKGLRVEQLILLRQLVLMSSFAGCIHHKSHDAVVVSEDDGIVRQIGQTSPRLLKTLQKTHSSNSPGKQHQPPGNHQPLVAIPCPTKNKPPKKKRVMNRIQKPPGSAPRGRKSEVISAKYIRPGSNPKGSVVKITAVSPKPNSWDWFGPVFFLWMSWGWLLEKTLGILKKCFPEKNRHACRIYWFFVVRWVFGEVFYN